MGVELKVGGIYVDNVGIVSECTLVSQLGGPTCKAKVIGFHHGVDVGERGVFGESFKFHKDGRYLYEMHAFKYSLIREIQE